VQDNGTASRSSRGSSGFSWLGRPYPNKNPAKRRGARIGAEVQNAWGRCVLNGTIKTTPPQVPTSKEV
jgi:hypothetical protein